MVRTFLKEGLMAATPTLHQRQCRGPASLTTGRRSQSEREWIGACHAMMGVGCTSLVVIMVQNGAKQKAAICHKLSFHLCSKKNVYFTCFHCVHCGSPAMKGSEAED